MNLVINTNTLDADIERIADDLMTNYQLCVAHKRYQLAELEFYYNHFEGQSYDVFAHKHGAEIQNGTWRLHGAGLDIVLKSDIYYGGILIRGLKSLDTENYIDGPWNVATTLIQAFGQVDDGADAFRLELKPRKTKVKYLRSIRVGLNLRRVQDAAYWSRSWRYILSHPVKTKKYKYAIYIEHCITHENWMIPEGLKLSERDANRYKNYFLAGQGMEIAGLIGKKKSVKHTCQLIGACHKNIKIS